MIRLKVHGGTLPDKRLCDSCRYAQVMKHSDGTERIMCFANGEGFQIRARVVECTDYAKRGDPSLYELKKIGWVLEMQGKQIKGFAQPKPRKDDD